MDLKPQKTVPPPLNPENRRAQVLDAPQRRHWAAAWTEMEDILGRAAFHRVFDYMHALALILSPQVGFVYI
jgi:hypothetical protein